MGMVKEFRDFAMRGNVLDLSVGIIIGAAFGKIIGSFVNDIMMPVLGLFIGGVDVTGRFVSLRGGSYATLADAKAAGAATLDYGVFLQSVIDFLIVAFAIFLLIKAVNTMQRRAAAAPAPPPGPTPDQKLLMEIRDLLKAR
jgi:large conductance mechanosensitive channel